MHFVLSGEWWEAQNWAQQIFWLVAIVSTFLLIIFSVLSLYELDQGHNPEPESFLSRIFTTRTILSFSTAFGWLSVLLHYLGLRLALILVFASAAGLLVAWLSKPLARLALPLGFPARNIQEDKLMERTGRVLEPIPPHRNGFGKVHLDLRDAPYELEAITAGGELPPGASIRVIGVIDGRVLLVEPIENEGYPHEQQHGLR